MGTELDNQVFINNMITKQFITIYKENSNQGIDLQIPFDKPLEKILPDILKALHIPSDHCDAFTLSTEHNTSLDKKSSLKEQGIDNFETLFLSSDGTSTMPGTESVSEKKTVPEQGSSTSDVLDYLEHSIEYPSLLSTAGYIFELNVFPAIIGRKSGDFIPQVDLSEIDKNMLCSRKHAQVTVEGKAYKIQPFTTTNGTFINNVQIPPNEVHSLVEGDTIQFGFRGVELIFKLPRR